MKGKKLSGLLFVLAVAVLFGIQPIGAASRAETAPSETVHSYRHTEKYRCNDNGDVVNQTVFTADDGTTYPFLYEFRMTEGDAWGMRGTQMNPITLMTGVKPDAWAKGCIYGDETFTGFNKSGGIASIDGDLEPRELLLTFVSPYDGAVSIRDFSIDYSTNYPNQANNYTVYGVQYPGTFDGYRYKVLLNGYQVYPERGWDDGIAQKYEIAADGFAVGDLVRVQEKQTVAPIYAERGDKVSLVLTKVNSAGVLKCDDVLFDAVFQVDTAASAEGYGKVTTFLDSFDYMAENSADETLSYYSYDCAAGYYDKAVPALMEQVDYASGAYCSGLFGEVAKINYNSFSPNVKLDAVLSYRADRTGNLTISSGNLFRGKDIAIWQYFDKVVREESEGLDEADGFRLRIEKNGKRIWPVAAPWQEYKPTVENRGIFDFVDVMLGVQKGDVVSLRFNCGEQENTLFDSINFAPVFRLTAAGTPAADPTVTPDPKDGGSGNEGDGNEGNGNGQGGTDEGKKGGCGGAAATVGLVLLACASGVVLKKTI